MKISKEIFDYMEWHPLCEACGAKAQGLPHHIKHRGAGGTDRPENLLRLCHRCHFEIVHGLPGIKALVRAYPHIRDKVLKMKPKMKSLYDIAD